jgi:signal transduction histidine kinase
LSARVRISQVVRLIIHIQIMPADYEAQGRNWMRLALPKRINNQLALLLVACVLLFHVLIVAVVIAFFPDLDDPRSPLASANISIAVALNAAAPSERAALASALNHNLPGLNLSLLQSSKNSGGQAAPDETQHFSVVLKRSLEADGALFATLQDGQTIQFSPVSPGPDFLGMILITLGFITLSVLAFSFWGFVAITRPLTEFAGSIASFDPITNNAPLNESGPEELRVAIRAYNHMRGRIREMMDQKTRMLAAVSHDLRTPITRIQLRAEKIIDADTRVKIQGDIEKMHGMVNACLTYLRSGDQQEREILDLASLLQMVAGHFTDMGRAVRFESYGKLIVEGSPEELERAISNLVDNAIKFGGNAEIVAKQEANIVVVEIADNGPGIQEEMRERVLEPFTKGKENVGEGFGLGLSIASAIITAHRGQLELLDRPGGGLIVRCLLPTACPPQVSAFGGSPYPRALMRRRH